MASITLDKLPELKDPDLTDKINILVLRDVYNSEVAYRTDIEILSSFYFPSVKVKELMDILDNLKQKIEDKIKSLNGKDYMIANNYVTKIQADKFRNSVVTEKRLDSVLTNFVTYDQLSTYVEDSRYHRYQITSEILNYMANAASTAKSGSANESRLEDTNLLLQDIGDKLESLGENSSEE